MHIYLFLDLQLNIKLMLTKLFPICLLLYLTSCTSESSINKIDGSTNSLKSFDSNQILGLRIHNLEGVYILGGHEKSWYLILKKMKNQFHGELFELEGMLPPANYLLLNQKDFIGKKFQIDDIDPKSLQFNSKLGRGKILTTSDPQQVVFEEIKSHLGDQLVLSYNKAYQILLK